MFNALPIITRYWFGATMLVTLSTNFGILSGNHIVFNWTAITTKFELWRLVSPFLFAGSFSFNTLIACYMLVSFSKQYELGTLQYDNQEREKGESKLKLTIEMETQIMSCVRHTQCKSFFHLYKEKRYC